MTVKIQRSLFSSTGNETMLVYNRDRSVQMVLPLDPAVQKELGHCPKGYFRARMKDKKLIIGARVADEDW